MRDGGPKPGSRARVLRQSDGSMRNSQLRGPSVTAQADQRKETAHTSDKSRNKRPPPGSVVRSPPGILASPARGDLFLAPRVSPPNFALDNPVVRIADIPVPDRRSKRRAEVAARERIVCRANGEIDDVAAATGTSMCSELELLRPVELGRLNQLRKPLYFNEGVLHVAPKTFVQPIERRVDKYFLSSA